MRKVKSVRTFMPVDLHVGSRVKSRRLQMKMSQTELGAQLGISFQQVQKYEKGRNRISSSRLQEIADILKVQPTYFFDDPLGQPSGNGRPDGARLSEFCANRHGLALMQAFVKIKDKGMQHAIAKLVETLAG